MIHYLTFDDVIAVHADLMLRLGRQPVSLRDEEALRGVVTLPEALAFYEGADLIRQAAALAVGIAHLKPFVAGNYLTAYAAMEAFLELNAHFVSLESPGPDLATYLHLVAGEHYYEHALTFFETRLRQRVSKR